MEIRRLLVDKRDETQRLASSSPSEPAGECEQRSDAASVVVRTGGAEHRVVVGPYQHNLRRLARNLHLDVVKSTTPHLIALALGTQTCGGERSLNVIGRGLELGIMKFIPLANITGELLHVGH